MRSKSGLSPFSLIVKYFYKLLIAAAIISSLFVLYFGFGLALSFSVNAYPAGSLLLLPWASGVCGVLGLLCALQERMEKSALGLRAGIALLCIGIPGALVFAAIVFMVIGGIAPGALTGLLLYGTIALLPVALALIEIYQSRPLLRAKPLVERAALRRLWIIALGGVFGLVAARVVAQEAVMAWYGRDLVAAAHASADRIANGRPYCVVARNGAMRFEELDKREILLAAAEKRAGFQGFNPTPKDPHFGITVDGNVYWWSFRLREFRALPSDHAPSWPGRNCAR